MEPENIRKTRLQKLSGSDFEVEDGQPDIRGWDVKDSNGKQLGEVEELIFDYESRKVRYLVVDLDENDYGLDDKEVLVPIGIAELHEKDDDVILPGVTAEQIAALPEYDEERFDTEHEAGVRNVFGGLGASALSGGSTKDEDFYNHDHFNDSNLYRNRTRRMVDDGSSAGALTTGYPTSDNPDDRTEEMRMRLRAADLKEPGTSSERGKNRDDTDEGLNEYPVR